MPASYTHYYFAREVYANLNDSDIQKIIGKYPDLYFIGCHGPDINFFYRPYKGNKIIDQAYAIHDAPGYQFFVQAIKTANQSPNREASWSYLLGFLTHFILDSNCHPYINNVIEPQTNEYHSTIESQYDRRFIIKDRLDPMTTHIRDHIVISRFNSEIIAPFFGLKPETIMSSLRGFKFFDGFFVTSSKLRRKISSFFLVKMKMDSHTGLFMLDQPEKSNLSAHLDHLDTLYHISLLESNQLLTDFFHKQELTSRYDRDFE